MDIKKLKLAYASQRCSSRKRNIKWEFTFEEWLQKWQESSKLHLRGRGKGKYLMGRIGDTGPYSFNNTEIISLEESERQRVANGKNTLGKNNGMYGKKGKDAPHAKAIINLDTNEVFYSFREAVESTGRTGNGSNICSVCTGNLKQAYGYKWAYHED